MVIAADEGPAAAAHRLGALTASCYGELSPFGSGQGGVSASRNRRRRSEAIVSLSFVGLVAILWSTGGLLSVISAVTGLMTWRLPTATTVR